MAKATANQIARSIPHPAGASTLAHMETRTTTEAATAAPNAGLKIGNKSNFSGQYLYDRFIANDKTEVTKLGIVRQMVEQLEVDHFKKSINDMVGVAIGLRDNLIAAEKEAGTYDKDAPSPEMGRILARLKTAKNHQTVMRIAYGAMKFAPEKLAEFGGDMDTGYQTMAVIGRKALDSKGIKWDGTKRLNDTEADRKAAAKLETKALEKVMEATPRNEDEGMADYLARCSGKVQDQLNADNAERERKQVESLVSKVRAMAGGLLDDVIEALLTASKESPTGEPLDVASAAQAAPAATKH